MANSALSKAKSVLGINSPSKVFAKIVGSAIPEGVAKGVIDNAHIAQRAVAGFSAGLTASPSGSAFGSSVSLSTSGAGGGTVVHHHTVNVTIQGSVMADTDLASTIQRVMARHGARNSSTYQAYKR
jgi:hypothetical protein